jgi:hypothetical protein
LRDFCEASSTEDAGQLENNQSKLFANFKNTKESCKKVKSYLSTRNLPRN